MENNKNNLAWPVCWKKSSKPHNFCPGCGHPIILKMLGQIIDETNIQNKTLFGIDIGCSLLAWDFFNVDTMQTHHGRTIPVMTGAKKSKKNSIIIAYLGDGGAYAIGIQHLISARIRNENITVIIVNNANYGMTGGQKAPTTVEGQITTTSLGGADKNHIDGPDLLLHASETPAYIARGCVDNPIQLKGFIKKAIDWQMQEKGFSFVEVLSFCPTNWKTDAKNTIDFMKKLKEIYPIKEFNK